jgi:hypothetical protein
MCPVCLTSLAVTVATTTGAGGAVAALALRLKRSFSPDRATEPQPRKDYPHELVETDRHA